MVHIKRHIAKTFSYRVLGSIFTIGLCYYLTGDVLVSSSLGVGELLVKPLLYFFHERIWYKWISFGIKKEGI